MNTVKRHTCTHLNTHELKSLTVKPDGLTSRDDTASLVCHHYTLILFPSAHSPCSSLGREDRWTFPDRTQVSGFRLPREMGGGRREGRKKRGE